MKRFKLLFDKDHEENWLNQMCQQGWAMVRFFAGVYTFIPCQPGEFIYQIDLLPGKGFTPEDPDGYMEFMDETGVEVLQRWARWVYLRKRAADGPFEIYTDVDSRIQMYSRIRAMFLWGLGLELCYSASLWSYLWRGEIFFYCLALLYLLIFAAFLRAAIRCSRKIQELERSRL